MQNDSCFLKRGNIWRIASKEALDMHDELPAAIYSLNMSMEGIYLETIDNFDIPKKLYGNTTKDAARIWNTFNSRKGTTGVLLTGEKGSGKTLLSKVICNNALNEGIPTIVINQPMAGDGFNTFIQQIEQKAILLFDEFEKVYDDESQQQILTLLDGVYNSTKLFLFTSNDKMKINSHMNNRPGRIFYMLEFAGLDKQFVQEYCEEKLKNQKHLQSVLNCTLIFETFNFDMLQALVEEMNRYNEPASEALRYLNIKPAYTYNLPYEVEMTLNGEPVKLESKEVSTSPLNRSVGVSYWVGKPNKNGVHPSKNYREIYLRPDNIVHMADGKYYYEQEEEGKLAKVVLSKQDVTKKFDYRDVL